MVTEMIPKVKNVKINGLKLTPLKQICDQRGSVMHYLNSDSPNYLKFGEVYFSTVKAGIIKGWKFHKTITQNFCIPFGIIKIVVYDNREKSETYGYIDEIILNNYDNYYLLTMPPKLWYSFKCISENYAIIANVIDEKHSQNETVIQPINSIKIPYDWE